MNLTLLLYILQTVVTPSRIAESVDQTLSIAEQNESRTEENLDTISNTLGQTAELTSTGRANISDEVHLDYFSKYLNVQPQHNVCLYSTGVHYGHHNI